MSRKAQAVATAPYTRRVIPLTNLSLPIEKGFRTTHPAVDCGPRDEKLDPVPAAKEDW
jgi:hypothetical protein